MSREYERSLSRLEFWAIVLAVHFVLTTLKHAVFSLSAGL